MPTSCLNAFWNSDPYIFLHFLVNVFLSCYTTSNIALHTKHSSSLCSIGNILSIISDTNSIVGDVHIICVYLSILTVTVKHFRLLSVWTTFEDVKSNQS